MNASVLAHRSSLLNEPSKAACLSFQLNEQTPALFSMHQVQEVIVLPANHITPMPNMAPCVLGLSTRRSRVMWLVDLAHMLLSTPLPQNIRSYSVVIIRVEQTQPQQNTLMATAHSHALLGLIVPTMTGVIHVSPDSIQTPKGHFASSLAPCLRGCLLQQDELLLVLDAAAIARSPILQTH
ncbi:MAG: chemotaxis protein CheW [Leptolyngbyaceae cyanobacterium]